MGKDRFWTTPSQDLWPSGIEHPDGFFYDYGGGIVLLLLLLGVVVNEIVQRCKRPSVDTGEASDTMKTTLNTPLPFASSTRVSKTQATLASRRHEAPVQKMLRVRGVPQQRTDENDLSL